VQAVGVFKREITIVLVGMAVIVMLPVIILVSATDMSALADSANQLYTYQVSTSNTYDFGYCTYWAALRRGQTGSPIPNNWGNANTWAGNALLAGYNVDHAPKAGAIMQTTAGPLGHVAYVEAVSLDGSWTISEMNFKGWDIVDERALTRSDAANYSFIHLSQTNLKAQ
jgi:surface antigen